MIASPLRTDAELVAMVKAGDESAFDVLKLRYRQHRESLAYRFRKWDRDEIELAANLGLWRGAKSFDPGRGVKASTWLMDHMRFGVGDFVRSEPMSEDLQLGEIYSSSLGDGGSGMERAEARAVIAKVESHVGPYYWRLLQMCAAGMTVREIGMVDGRSGQAAAKAIEKARQLAYSVYW
jgi:hypothetical protein